MTVLAFLGALALLIAVHEWGHYRVAVACGVKVLTFSVGFGRSLLRWRSRQPHPGQHTEFVIGLIPLGGYVKMLDENEADVAPEDLGMAFNRQPLVVRAAIVSAGPLANLLLAVVLYAATFWVGQYETRALMASPIAGSPADMAGLKSGDLILRAGTSAESLQEIASLEDLRWWSLQQDLTNERVFLEVKSSSESHVHLLTLARLASANSSASVDSGLLALGLGGAWSRPVLGDLTHQGAADRAGLQRGDEVLRIDDRVIVDAAALRATVRESGVHQAPRSQIWHVQRANQGVLTVEVTPEWVNENAQPFGRIGARVGEAPAKDWVQYGLFDGLSRAITRTREMVEMTVTILGRLVVGQASLDHLSGPLTMADYAGRTASVGLGAYLSYLALLSVSLGIFNLLPLPVLDGGHLLYYLYEAFTGRPPAPQWLEVMQRLGFAFLVALMAFSLFNDVVRLGWLS
jgi:regulator of sigma E protease